MTSGRNNPERLRSWWAIHASDTAEVHPLEGLHLGLLTGQRRQVRLATIEPGQNRICLIGLRTFEALLSNGEIVEASQGWE